ncbi:heme ABC exporter ATP-binding protein CcmA [Erythrobacter sp. 3-20A1M]|uniref:heme ABC exporter ATP-binding protein CcmA n=1 Tax=Erythrobacter sp. 3-20A1M TaxID=2653850 RepID=UPI001BFCD39D|nr:heme ABC exporter ATP-binding protein CcmA [Erythrobacter sp. 3-20A1M]QWC56200.1 heme ABC exporter ATP-binding protein CcmA [Erythrobacter sp. 3-20A1M]
MQASGLTAWALFCRRGDRPLFGGLDLWLDRGAALHLVGPNGIGKTSLLQILAGLRRPERAVSPDGARETRGSIHWTGTVGLLDERPALDPDLPLGKALGFWSRLDRAQPALDAVGLAQIAEVPVRYLSTGQRKRAGWARLLAQGCDHWLLDEPFNGLDSDSRAIVEDLMRQRREGGGVLVIASHQPFTGEAIEPLDLRDHPW